MPGELLTRPIIETLPLLARSFPSAPTNIPAYFTATILGERSVLSLAIMDGQRLVGEVRFLEILRYIYPLRDGNEKPSRILEVSATEIMNNKPNKVDPTASLLNVIRKFEASRSGVTYVVDDTERIVGAVTLRDVTMIVASSGGETDIPCRQLATRSLVKLPPNATLGEAVEAMMDKFVRKIVIAEDEDIVGVIDDRDVTQAIFNNDSSEQSYADILKIQVKSFVKAPRVVKKLNANKLAQVFLRTGCNYVLTNCDGIVTDWDMSIKWARKTYKPPN